jgi:Rap1a immunity proteins
MLTDQRFSLLATAALAFVVLLPQHMFAIGFSNLDGNQLLKECTAYSNLLSLPNVQDTEDPDVLRAMARGDFANGAHCLGYVTGIVDDHFNCQINEASSTAALDPTKHFCLPDGVTPNQTVRVVVKWLGDHPARLHEGAIGLVIDALKENFPCRQKH